MLDEILDEQLTKADITASNQPLFSTNMDYAAAEKARKEAIDKWKSLASEEKAKFSNDQKKFLVGQNLPNLKDPTLGPARNFMLLKNEADSRIKSQNALQLLPIDGIDFDNSVLELVESIENTEHIRELYKLRKQTTGASENAGINAQEGRRIKNCLSQGRDLYLAGKHGSLMVKPLNFFYALTAYTYAIIILNNPIRYAKGNIPGSHGMQYLPDKIQAQFGGDTAKGTFSDLVTSFPTQLVKNRNLEIVQDCVQSVVEFYRCRFGVSTGLLMSLVPEMSEYYKLITGKNSRAHPLEIANANDTRSLKWEFQIGNGEHKPPLSSVEEEFKGFSSAERHGKIVVTVPAADAHKIRACIYTDIRGKFWYIENPFFPVILPEVCVHFLITNIFASIMRYRPDEWGDVLLNEVSSGVSLIARHYFTTFERKFFILVLRSISKYTPYVE
jgi:hypothetical protein